MVVHYIIQGIFAMVGLTALLASLFDCDWFFNSSNTLFVVKNVGRKQARLFYALLGVFMIATAIYFFLEVQQSFSSESALA